MNPTPLSEAIRLGGTLGPQCFNRLAMVRPLSRAAANHSDGGSSAVDSIPYDDVLFTCALGGCLVAMGVPEKTLLHDGMLDHDYFIEFWPSVREVSTHCRLCVAREGSICAGIKLSILDLIVHLNDSHHFNRDEIADIVRPFDEAVAKPFNPYRAMTFSGEEMKAWDEAAYLADMKRLADEDADMSTRTAAGVEIARLYAEMRQRLIARHQLDFLKFTPTPKFLITPELRNEMQPWTLKAELVT